ncbi:MAG TPA: phosphoketolase family protein, partial [Kofleriaceae bacterium]
MDNELSAIDAWWRAANYLTVGQIYLQANPLLAEPLQPAHIKPRLLGHWGTSPGLSLIYAHLNRLIRRDQLDVLFLAGPGHGGPAVVANTYLEGTYSEVYPHISQDRAGMLRLFRQFSTPGGIPSHVGPTTPGSIHEGGELGYVLTHAFGAVFDHPKLVAVAVVGDGEAETAPLEGSWKGVQFLDPTRDGAVLPILHLNGYKIAGPTVLGRAEDSTVIQLLAGHGYAARVVSGDRPEEVHRALARTLELCLDEIRAIQSGTRAPWPAIILRTPKGWTGQVAFDGVPIEGTFRAHQVPLTKVKKDPAQLAMLEQWMRSYRPEELFDKDGRLCREIAAQAPEGPRRMSATPYANGGGSYRPLEMPPLAPYAVAVPSPGTIMHESTRVLGELMRDLYRANPESFRLFCPDETNSNRLGAVFEAT